jgi:hypothetical protein
VPTTAVVGMCYLSELLHRPPVCVPVAVPVLAIILVGIFYLDLDLGPITGPTSRARQYVYIFTQQENRKTVAVVATPFAITMIPPAPKGQPVPYPSYCIKTRTVSCFVSPREAGGFHFYFRKCFSCNMPRTAGNFFCWTFFEVLVPDLAYDDIYIWLWGYSTRQHGGGRSIPGTYNGSTHTHTHTHTYIYLVTGIRTVRPRTVCCMALSISVYMLQYGGPPAGGGHPGGRWTGGHPGGRRAVDRRAFWRALYSTADGHTYLRYCTIWGKGDMEGAPTWRWRQGGCTNI